ncbi:hypothetical protein L228DRAFT_246408 [Xylona heveae TC161]|uniref:Small ribosomal subunit protein mS38 n=1 Tax=Xylona heveae (strain CBS 132557 / TC161) TaxID=1328760 RepID=A0A165HJE7_XYLHT|nr:hypothetical protein L228DRAFT_246408 [Xylona heveae TC161]KZF23602.1 hypothetical protein L228DRAFT_246408 [Xylona heveae TC161]
MAAAASTRSISVRRHQRRYSSSKPSSPPDGSEGIDAQQQTPSNGSSESRVDGSKRNANRLNRRKAKDAAAEATHKGKHEAFVNLPSVPSTPHLHPSDVAVSAFFSLHRPISITSSVPAGSTSASFNTIFEPRTKNNRQHSEVISTLSSAVDSLEAAAGSQQQTGYTSEEAELRAALAQAQSLDVKHLDGAPAPSSLQFPGHLLTGKFKPFSPPPAPRPMKPAANAEEAAAVAEEAEAATSAPTKQKSYSTVLTILESTMPDGAKTYTARTTPFVADENTPPARRFLDRMWLRQERWEDSRRDNGSTSVVIDEASMPEQIIMEPTEALDMEAISVKRQRKLKMKKHKYKKLMRRTRNLRRRLDRN